MSPRPTGMGWQLLGLSKLPPASETKQCDSAEARPSFWAEALKHVQRVSALVSEFLPVLLEPRPKAHFIDHELTSLLFSIVEKPPGLHQAQCESARPADLRAT